MDAAKVGKAIVRLADEQGEGLFLLARVSTAQLRREPIDTSLPGWEIQLADSVEVAFQHDLARILPLSKDDAELPQAAGELLAALAWGYGAGLPDDVWPIVATALSPTNVRYGRDDVFWIVGQAGRYIVEDGEAGRAVYRLSHQRLADHLRRTTAAGSAESAQRASRLAMALVDHYEQLLTIGLAPAEPAYLWRYAWRHAADGGLPGIDAFRRLVDHDRDAFLPGLALALNNLGSRYSEVGRRVEAVAPAEEAVSLHEELTAANAAFLPELAMALGNLGIRYSEVGRSQEAVAPATKAVGLYRQLAAANPAFLPDLARTLGNLGSRYSEVGRLHEAVAPSEEAVDLFREVAPSDPRFLPDLALALNNLGGRYSEVGRLQEAVASAEEAVGLYRELARGNPRFLPNLAGNLNNLGGRYSEVGRLQEAVASAEEAVGLFRELARGNPRFLPDVAMGLDNLGLRYSEAGRPQEAVAPAEEAVDLYRELADGNPRFLPNLAMALGNLGSHYTEAGRLQEAVAPAEEAVDLYRELARGNPGLLPNLAIALNNLSTCYREAGQRRKAVAPAEESVRVFRELARGNPRFLPNLAIALSNLGNPYSEAERSDAIENWWDETISSLPSPRSKAFILLRRARSRTLTDPSAIDDLLAAQALITDSDGDLIADLHHVCRTHRAYDPRTFDSRWRHKDDLLPRWLLIDEADLELMWRWISSSPETAAKQFLTEHAETLLTDSSELVLDEIAFRLPDRSMIEPHRQLLREARRVGIDEAYRRRLAAELLRTWLRATLEAKQAMLREQQTRVELLAPEVASAFQALRNADPDNTALVVHQALLALARADHDDIAFEAPAEPERFPALLAELARADERPALDAMATLAAIAGVTDAEQASGWFHKAIALALAEDHQAALNAARHARRLDASQITTWLALLVELAGRHPNVIPLTQALAETP